MGEGLKAGRQPGSLGSHMGEWGQRPLGRERQERDKVLRRKG